MSDRSTPEPIDLPGTQETDYPELCEQLRKGFSEVLDPELGLNVVQLGLIRNVKIDDDRVIVKMILTTLSVHMDPRCWKAHVRRLNRYLSVRLPSILVLSRGISP